MVTLAKCRNLKYVKDKFQGSPNVIKGLCGSLTDSHPIIFCWASLKGGNLNLVERFDQVGHLRWRSPQEFSPGFACDSVLASFLTFSGSTFDLRHGDEGSLASLSCPLQVASDTHTTQHTEYSGNSALIKISLQYSRM